MCTLSVNPSNGTGVPHFKSLVMQRGLRPSGRIHEDVIWLEFVLHSPFFAAGSNQSCKGWYNCGRSRKMCSVVFLIGGLEQTLQRGFFNSVWKYRLVTVDSEKLCTYGIEKLLAFITLVSTSIFICTVWASSLYKTKPNIRMNNAIERSNVPVSKEALASSAEKLFHGVLKGESILVQLVENVLGDLGLLLSGGTSKLIKRDAKPLIDFSMDLVVLVTNCTRSCSFLQSFCFCCCSIFICAADIQGVVSSQTAESVCRINIYVRLYFLCVMYKNNVW